MRGPYNYISVWYMSKIYTLSSPNQPCHSGRYLWSKDTLIWLPTTYEVVCQTPFICIKWIWYEYEGDGRHQSYPTACPQWETHTVSYNPAHPFTEWWYGMVLHPYGHPLHIKHAKHLLYVWTGFCISMKGMGGPNHILQHVPREKPTENPTTVPTPSRDGMVWCCGIMTASHGWRLFKHFL